MMFSRLCVLLFFLALAAPAAAQPQPDPRQRVDIRYDRPATKNGANFARIRDSQCRESVADVAAAPDLRRRIVALAAQEWEAFRFPVLDIASEGLPLVPRLVTRASPRGLALIPDVINPPLAEPQRRALRLGLAEDDGPAIERIGGYWATVPGQGAVATQNVIWGKGGWPGAGWAQPWSAAFVSWVMCEAGFSRAQFFRAASHAGYLEAIFSAPEQSAFLARDAATPLSPGDLVCAGREEDHDIATIEEARSAIARGGLMHCDIVVGLLPDRALLIGGNVMNAVALTVAPTDAKGRIRPNGVRRWFGVMKLRAPEDGKAGLRRATWACLDKQKGAAACPEGR